MRRGNRPGWKRVVSRVSDKGYVGGGCRPHRDKVQELASAKYFSIYVKRREPICARFRPTIRAFLSLMAHRAARGSALLRSINARIVGLASQCFAQRPVGAFIESRSRFENRSYRWGGLTRR